jgi:hypothetical protein
MGSNENDGTGNDHDEHATVTTPEGTAEGEAFDPVPEKAAFTRRTFIAGAGAAAAATVVKPALAFAATGADPIYRIHPAIGVARLGNAPANEHFIGPEIPGYGPLTPPGTYKNSSGQIKRQAARFRIYEYGTRTDGTFGPLREVTADTPGVSITWTVHLANRKAAFHGFEGGQGDPTRNPVVPAAPLRNATVTDRASLQIDPGPRSITGKNATPVEFRLAAGAVGPKTPTGQLVIDYLGELRTDAQGRLIVVPGQGKSGWNTATQPAMPHWANNDGWFDDASDGPVTATVTITSGGTTKTIQVGPDGGAAWVLCGPPDFAPGIPGSITGFDLLTNVALGPGVSLPANHAAFAPSGPLADIAALKPTFPNVPNNFVRFEDHIEPQLIAAYNLWYIEGLVTAKHNTLLDASLGDAGAGAKSKRDRVFSYMRLPADATAGTGSHTMPKLLGDDPYSGQFPEYVRNLPVTRYQFELLRQWAAGNFTHGERTSPVPPTDTTYWTSEANAVWAAYGLDRAALENCVGGAFFPGIEYGWQMRNPDIYFEPFRIQLDAPRGYILPDGTAEPGTIMAGYFTRQMAVPWQADFNDCRNEGNYGWWPTQRPTHAITSPTSTSRVDWARPSGRSFSGGNKESTHEDMVKNWYKFGFVLVTTTSTGTYYVEKERATSGIA